MAAAHIPREIREFVARFLPSVEHLDAFVALYSNAARSWSPSTLAVELCIPEDTAANVLERLASDNLLAVQISSDIFYRFNPGTDAIATVSALVASLYAREPIAIISLVTKNA